MLTNIHFKNTEDRFGMIAILLHWVMAILIVFMLILGLYMAGLPRGLEKLKLYGWHKEFGMLVLMLAVLRLIWRNINLTPKLNIPWLEKFAARTVHYAFYVFMLAMPITGWLITSAAGLPVSFFGLFVIPTITPVNHDHLKFFEAIHQWIAYGLIATIVLHVLAAFKHDLIDKDDILRRML